MSINQLLTLSFLCGAIPIYIEMSVDPKIGIALGLENDRVAKAIKDHPDAKAILINNLLTTESVQT